MKAFKWGIEIFDSAQKQYGGHWQLIGRKIPMSYLRIYLVFGFKFFETYYDGYHTRIDLGLFGIMWGDMPFKRDDYH